MARLRGPSFLSQVQLQQLPIPGASDKIGELDPNRVEIDPAVRASEKERLDMVWFVIIGAFLKNFQDSHKKFYALDKKGTEWFSVFTGLTDLAALYLKEN